MARHAGGLRFVFGALVLLLALYLVSWWIGLPRTPREFFQARCSTCHRLPDLCPYTPVQREDIVVTMRTQHGAGDIIDDEEAQIIGTFLKEQLECP